MIQGNVCLFVKNVIPSSTKHGLQVVASGFFFTTNLYRFELFFGNENAPERSDATGKDGWNCMESVSASSKVDQVVNNWTALQQTQKNQQAPPEGVALSRQLVQPDLEATSIFIPLLYFCTVCYDVLSLLLLGPSSSVAFLFFFFFSF